MRGEGRERRRRHISVAHETTGVATIHQLSDGKRLVRLIAFGTTKPAPALAWCGGLEAKGKHERYRCLGRGFPVASQLLALGEVDVLSRCSRHTSSGALPVLRCKPSAHARTWRNHVGRGISSPVVTHWVNR
jgi:hypothetical protein